MSSPIINPVFLINNWGQEGVVPEINGSVMAHGSGFRLGHQDTLDASDRGDWKNVLVLWVQMNSFEPARMRLWRASSHPDG
jgi:hypothetical protein